MSQVATYRDKRQVVPRAYAPGGCPIHLGKQKCGETKGLDIIMDFHKLYQEKMKQIDVSAGGDNLQEKVDLQQEWINDLTEQNKMLAKVIEELESEAIGRVQQLEDKLKNAVKSFGEVIFYLNHDLKSVLEFVRRIREDKKWSINGLYFYEVKWEDLFGAATMPKIREDEDIFADIDVSGRFSLARSPQDGVVPHGLPISTCLDLVTGQNDFIKCEKEVVGTDESLIRTKPDDKRAPASEDIKKMQELAEAVKARPAATEDLRKKDEENDRLKQDMDEMRSALSEEIAHKHDIISLLRQEICQLEEKNIETQKEAYLKDDIIKELRRELIKAKHKIPDSEARREHVMRQIPETSEKGINTAESEFLTINHSTIPKDSKNSTVIVIHRGQIDEKKDPRAIFDSSDSSECGLNEGLHVTNKGLVHSCRSENDMKRINWIKPTKERSKLTRTHKNDVGDYKVCKQGRDTKESSRKLSIPKHIPVKTYVNNIEYIKDVE